MARGYLRGQGGTAKQKIEKHCVLVKYTVTGSRQMVMFGGTLVIGLIMEPLGFVQDAQDVMVLFDERLVVLVTL